MEIINDQIRNIQDNASSQIEKINIDAQKHIDLLYKLKDVLPTLEVTLGEVGFYIIECSSHRTGAYRDGDGLRVSLKLLPLSPKFKFIKHNGYNKRGGAKNGGKLREKASKYNQKVLNKMGIDLSFNPYSFEEVQGIENKTILAEFWIQ